MTILTAPTTPRATWDSNMSNDLKVVNSSKCEVASAHRPSTWGDIYSTFCPPNSQLFPLLFFQLSSQYLFSRFAALFSVPFFLLFQKRIPRRLLARNGPAQLAQAFFRTPRLGKSLPHPFPSVMRAIPPARTSRFRGSFPLPITPDKLLCLTGITLLNCWLRPTRTMLISFKVGR